MSIRQVTEMLEPHHVTKSYSTKQKQGDSTLDTGDDKRQYDDIPALILRTDGMRLGPLHELQVAHSGQFHGEVGQRVAGAVDNQYLQDDVVVVYRDTRLRVDRIGIA